MISVVVSSKNPKEEFKQHLKKTSGLQNIEILQYQNNGEFSLNEIYNRGLRESKYDKVIFCHDDLEVLTNNFGKKILKHFEKNPEYGILGVAGTPKLTDGCWWGHRDKMKGIVDHRVDGKQWTSKYSEHIGDEIDSVIIVDGVFFAVNKEKIKKEFDESFKGFHFYDLAFCFPNFLEGVKIGVIYNIRICHFSPGATNQDWENNKKQFDNKYDDDLPITLKKVFRPNEKIKVLIGCLFFNNYTGSELYVFELSKELMNQNCDVTVCSQVDMKSPLVIKAKQLGIKVYPIQEPPGYKLGDGIWGFNTPNGQVLSNKGELYKMEEVKYDVLHLNHTPITEHFLNLYPNINAICSIHSEVIDLEHPVIHKNIKKYIAIRPEIKQFMIDDFYIDENMIDVIYNPIDYTRFKVKPNMPKRNKKRVLFMGTIDYIRKATILDLIEVTRNEGSELYIVGKKHDTYLDNINESHVKWFDATPNPEKFIHECDESAGIQLGRTTIESWLCGKPSIIYSVNKEGKILGKELHQVPSDIDKFRCDNVVKQIIERYKEIV